MAVGDPTAVAARWAQVLGVPLAGGQQSALRLDDAEVRVVEAEDERAEGLVEIAVALRPELRRGRDVIELGGVRMRLLDAD